MSDQEKQNIAKIFIKAKEYMNADRKAALKRNDIETAVRIANNEAIAECFLERQGIITKDQ